MRSREDYRELPVLEERAKVLRKVVWVLTVVVLVLVALMRSPYKIPLPDGVSTAGLPAVSAFLNTLVAASLLSAVWAIIRGNARVHQRFMTVALILSSMFLLVYVSYHFTTVETRYGGEGWQRGVYFFILITHIIAAAVSFPMILMTFVHAWTRDFVKHKKLARVVFPLWLYVAVTGPVCYFMLKPYYGAGTVVEEKPWSEVGK